MKRLTSILLISALCCAPAFAALSATTVWEVGAGNDTNNGGAFDPGQSAGMFTDLACTSANTTAPVCTSASYNFVAGDVGAWLYVNSGTNWTTGWCKIASVASNAATLTGTIGACPIKGSSSFNTTAGVASTASPTAGTWTIDYSQQASPVFTYTDLASVGTGLTVTSVAHPFGKQQVGNCLVITSGTNFNAGRYCIASISTVTATVVGPTNITTGAGVSGVGSLGGELAGPVLAASIAVAGNFIFVNYNTGTCYSITASISSSVAIILQGYNTNRAMLNGSNTADTSTCLQTSGSTVTMFNLSGGMAINFIADGNTQTAAKAFSTGSFVQTTFKNFNTASSGTNNCVLCVATANSAAVLTGNCIYCEMYANTATVYTGSANTMCVFCISSSNTGASTDGISLGSSGLNGCIGCTLVSNGRDGARMTAGGIALILNTHMESNTGAPYTLQNNAKIVWNSSYYGNGSAPSITGTSGQVGNIAVTVGSPLTNPGSNIFSLNATTNQGALLRNVGLPAIFPRGTTPTYLDIGASRHQDPAGSGATVGYPVQ